MKEGEGLKEVTVVYRVAIDKKENEEDTFIITWKTGDGHMMNQFERVISKEAVNKIEGSWKKPEYQMEIGEELFDFLDGDKGDFEKALKKAGEKGIMLEIFLSACEEINNWPFELLAFDNDFLLAKRLHLVRRVSEWGIAAEKFPENRRLRLLFMASSAIDVTPVLDYEKEEEVIYEITEDLAIDIVVEDSGSLEGLKSKLVQKQYDVVHLSGHADIGKDGKPYFVMEDETGNRRNVSPAELWRDALIENPPRLLFLSACRTAEAPEGSDGSFAQQIAEGFRVPAVLGWGLSVHDEQAIKAEELIYQELSRGRSITDAVYRGREILFDKTQNTDSKKSSSRGSDWPLLRLFNTGVPLNAIVEKEQIWQPRVETIRHGSLFDSDVEVLEEGFVGRRRQIQQSVFTLKKNIKKFGLLMMGTAGLGKSCLAGKVIERFEGHNLIIVNGILNNYTFRQALDYAFIASQDHKARQRLSDTTDLKDTLGDFCASCFKDKNYLILLNNFEANIEGAEKGKPDRLKLEAIELLEPLLQYIHFSGKMTQLIITSRYAFSLTSRRRNLVELKLEPIWLTGLSETARMKKTREFEHFPYLPGWEVFDRLVEAGAGNPLLMEQLDALGEKIPVKGDRKTLYKAFIDKQKEFVRINRLMELLQWGGRQLKELFSPFAVFRKTIHRKYVQKFAEQIGVNDWEPYLLKGMELGIIEHNRVRESYRVTPLLRDELLKETGDLNPLHLMAFDFYSDICKDKKANDVDTAIGIEWLFHAKGCGKEDAVPPVVKSNVSVYMRKLAKASEERKARLMNR